MKNDESQRLFFIEICIAIVFFLMIAVTCFMGFTKSKIMQTDANKKITYVNIAENAAETFLASKDVSDACDRFTKEFDNVKITENLIEYPSEGFSVNVDIEQTGNTMQSIITIIDKELPVYQLSVTKALGEATE